MRQPLFYAVLAQLVERRSPKPGVAGSSPANGAIAAGSAYPAQNRRRKENRVTKPWFHTQKGVFHHETRRCEKQNSQHHRYCPGAGRGPVGRTDKKPVKRGTGLTSRPHIAQTGAQTKRKGVTSYDATPFLVGGKELESLTPCTSSRCSTS